MEVKDLVCFFNECDVEEKGHLTSSELITCYQTLFNDDVDHLLTTYVLTSTCGSQSCSSEKLSNVLYQLQVYRKIEDSAYWDFQTLIHDSSGTVELSLLMVLARTVKGDDFSLKSWLQWVDHRRNPLSKVSWEEFRTFLYYVPDDTTMSTNTKESHETAQKEIIEKEKARKLDEYRFYKDAFDNEEWNAKEEMMKAHLYKDHIQTQSKRIINRWDIGGIRAVIHDDGTAWNKSLEKDFINISQLLEALDEKYDLLRKKLLWEMVVHGNEIDATCNLRMNADDLVEKYKEAISTERSLRENNKLQTSSASDLYGSTLTYNGSISYYMGIDGDHQQQPVSGDQLIQQLELCHQQEKECLLTTDSSNTKRDSDNLLSFLAIYRQCNIVNKSQENRGNMINNFDSVLAGISLAESAQIFKPDQFKCREIRQEVYASDNIKRFKQIIKNPQLLEETKDGFTSGISKSNEFGQVESSLELIRILEKRHESERLRLVEALLKMEEYMKSFNKTSKLSRLNQIRNTLKEMARKSNRDTNQNLDAIRVSLLAEALALTYYEPKWKSKKESISTKIMAKLLNIQDEQIRDIFTSLKEKNTSEIYRMRKDEYRLLRDQNMDNLMKIVFTEETTKTQLKTLLKESIELKFDVLRTKLFRENFSKEKNASKEELVKEMKKKEREARNNDKDLIQILPSIKISQSPKEIFGPNNSWFASQVDSREQQTKDRARYINDSDVIDNHEHILVHMKHRAIDEFDVLDTKMTSQCGVDDVSGSMEKLVEVEMMKQEWMAWIVAAHAGFLPSSISLGLLERSWCCNDIKLYNDNERYIACEQHRLLEREAFETDVEGVIDTEIHKEKETLKLLMKRHQEEWKLFNYLLSHEHNEELCEIVKRTPYEERMQRLNEIREKKSNFSAPDDREELMTLLDEGIAIKMITRKEIMKRLSSEEDHKINFKDIATSLLADLHEEQDANVQHWFQTLQKSGKRNAMEEMNKNFDNLENLFRIVCKYEAKTSDRELLQALDAKYDSVRDKLIAEVLMRQHGESEWSRLNEQERQKKLAELKLQEKKLRKEGNIEALMKLLGDDFANDKRLKSLFGASRSLYEQRIKEQLEARRRGKKLSNIEEEEEEDEGLWMNEINKNNNPFLDLSLKYEEEKEELLRTLKNNGKLYENEKERQMEIVRLKQSRIRAQSEDKYQLAALMSGLITRESNREERLKSDQEKQRYLARERLRKKITRRNLEPIMEENETCDYMSRDQVEESAMALLSRIHEWERNWLILQLEQASWSADLAGSKSTQEIQHFLHVTRTLLPENKVKPDDNIAIIDEMIKHRQIFHSQTSSQKEDVSVAILAELQQVQDTYELETSHKFQNMNRQQLLEEREKLAHIYSSQISINIVQALLRPLMTKFEELDDAIRSKKDAIIDALITEVFRNQKYASLSEEDRELKKREMFKAIKKLMEKGDFDAALQLLTDGLDSDSRDRIISMFSTDFQEEMEKFRQKLEKEKDEKIEHGMSREEADQWANQKEEEFMKTEKKRRNILEELQKNFDGERDEINRLLQESNDKFALERMRQAEIARLRLEERKLKRHHLEMTSSQIFARSRRQNDKFDEERKRQLELARARLLRHKEKKDDDVEDEKNNLQDDGVDLSACDAQMLNEIILKEIDSKHGEEVRLLLKLIDEASGGSDVRNRARSVTSQEKMERIRELRELRGQWKSENDQEIFLEAIALQLESVLSDHSMTETEGCENLLAHLQQEQDRELQNTIKCLQEQERQHLVDLAERQRQSRVNSNYDNLAKTLLGQHQAASDVGADATVLKTLEQSYDIAKDKLIAQALIDKLGEQEWFKISEKERQHRITQIKRKERKLRLQGKYDEIEQLFNHLAISDAAISKMLGESQLSQQEMIKARLERKKKLKEEHEDAGVDIDDEKLEELVEEQEHREKQNKQNILLLLDRNLEEEKKAILDQLRRQDEQIDEERKRQLIAAKLRRQQRRLEQEEKYNVVGRMFKMAKENQDNLFATLEQSREDQLALARRRLEERKRAQKQKKAIKMLMDISGNVERIEQMYQEEQQGNSIDRLVNEMELKHGEEVKMLMLLYQYAEENSKNNNVGKLKDQEIRSQLTKFATERKTWRSGRFVVAMKDKISTDEMSATSKRILADMLVGQNRRIADAFVLKLEEQRRQIGSTEGDNERIFTEWLVQVQRSQDKEIAATVNTIQDQTDELIEILREQHTRARRECWYDHVGKVVFDLPLPGQEGFHLDGTNSLIPANEEEENEIDIEVKKQMQLLDEEVEEEKKKLKNADEVDIEAATKKLYEQLAAKKKIFEADSKRQRSEILSRIRARQQQKNESEFEAHAAAGMVLLAQKRQQQRHDQNKNQLTRQKTFIEETLKARRERRKKELQGKATEEKKKSANKPSASAAPSPFGFLQREKTVIDVKVSDAERSKMVEEIHNRANKQREAFQKERMKQQQKIEQRKVQAKYRPRKEELVARTLIEKQKEQEDKIRENQQRQLQREKTMLGERLTRIKSGRTIKPEDRRKKNMESFAKVAASQNAQGISDHEQMEIYAEKLQKKLEEAKKSTGETFNGSAPTTTKGENGNDDAEKIKSAEVGPEQDQQLLSSGDVPGSSDALPQRQLLSKSEKMKILRQRTLRRKQQKQRKQLEEDAAKAEEDED